MSVLHSSPDLQMYQVRSVVVTGLHGRSSVVPTVTEQLALTLLLSLSNDL